MRTGLATVDARAGVVILKRLWAETALRLQCSEEVLKLIVGDELGEQVLERKSRGGGVEDQRTQASLCSLCNRQAFCVGCVPRNQVVSSSRR